MAIGDYGNNNNNGSNNGKLFENTYYSRLKQKTENLALGFSFRSGLLIFEISEKKEGFKYDPLINIFLSPTKAKLLAEEILKFKNYYLNETIVPGKAYGVNAGMNDKVSYIGFHTDEDRKILVTIGKIDGEGNITESVTTNLNMDYHFALEWENINNMNVAKSYNDILELDQLYELCLDFGRHMNGAIAYSVIDLARFDNARILRKMDPIYDKLGIERNFGNGNSSRGSNNFLENSGRVQSNHTSIDDLMNPPYDGD